MLDTNILDPIISGENDYRIDRWGDSIRKRKIKRRIEVDIENIGKKYSLTITEEFAESHTRHQSQDKDCRKLQRRRVDMLAMSMFAVLVVLSNTISLYFMVPALITLLMASSSYFHFEKD